ncbi:Flp pilus assembly complex ATPase component TadA [Candidatus Falkowbacteria bacterium]|nr:Flp pilus assembly complex ATPase component TadA [Candidatus Falkowbacteria bacterium]
MSKDLGKALVKGKVITDEQLQKAKEHQKQGGGRLTSSLVVLGILREDQLVEFLSQLYSVPAVNLNELAPDISIVSLISKRIACKHLVIPINQAGKTLIVAMADPSNRQASDEIKFLTDLDVEVVVASEQSIKEAIERFYPDDEGSLEEFTNGADDLTLMPEANEEVNLAEFERASEEVPVIKAVSSILTDAIKRGASHIHIEPTQDSLCVRYRVDGILYKIASLPSPLKRSVIARLKIMSGMDIAERRLWQEGNLKIRMSQGREAIFNVTAMPTVHGEKIVLKLPDKSIYQMPLKGLGLAEPQLRILQRPLSSSGLVIITGDNSRTTLYSALRKLNEPDVSIVTAEDAICDLIPGINQTEMHEEIGLNFASALGALSRQNPDVLMVSGLPDFETGERALGLAARQLVLAGMEMNDAASVIYSLLNRGIEPYKISENLKLVLAQRQVRTVCATCKKRIKIKPKALRSMGIDPDAVKNKVFFKGSGCSDCNGTGFQGSMLIFEALAIDENIQELILSSVRPSEIKKMAMEQGMMTLRQSGIQAVLNGLTTFSEIARVTEAD